MAIRIATFGRIHCLLDDHELVDLPRQRSRCAVLVYLAIEREATRESLYNMFWPDRDEEKARGALKQTLYELRRQLGAAWVDPRPDPLTISPLVRTDVADFQNAVEAGNLAAALALYRGDFLREFSLPNCKEFEFWVDRKRAHYARMHRTARRNRIAQLMAAGMASEAVLASRQWVELDPREEEAQHTLIELLAATGQRTEALQQYESYERLLAADQLQPLKQTVALVAALRAANSDETLATRVRLPTTRERADVTISPSGSPASQTAVAAPQRPVQSSERSWRFQALRSSTRLSALIALALIATLALGAALVLRNTRRAALPILAVGRIKTEDGTDSLAAPLSDMIATNLARVPTLQVISSARFYGLLGHLGGPAGRTISIADAARHAGATELVEGWLRRSENGRQRLELWRAELRTGAQKGTFTIDGSDVFVLADRATARLASDLGLSTETLHVSEVTTTSLPGYRLYENGLRSLGTADDTAALRLFEAALAQDSMFALAALYAWHSRNLTGQATPVPRIERLDTLASRAPDRERLLFRSALRARLGDPTYLAIAETLAVRYPTEPEGHFRLGVARVERGDFLDALPHLRTVILMDSMSMRSTGLHCLACNALSNEINAYQLVDSGRAAERVSREWMRHQPGSPDPWHHLGLALATQGRYEEAAAAYRSAAPASGPDPINATFLSLQVQILAGDFVAVDRFSRELIRDATAEMQRSVLWFLIISLRNQGRLREALETARRLEAMVDPAQRSGQVMLRAQVQFELGRFREAAQAFDSLAAFPDPSITRGILARGKSWTLTHLATTRAAARDTAGLVALLEPLQTWGARSSYGRDRLLYRHANALLLEARGRLEEAAAELRLAIYSPTMGYTRTNYELGRILLTLNRPAEAVSVLEPALRGSTDASNMYITRTELHELLGQAYEAAGQPDRAATHHEWVLKAWRNADPQFHARRDSVRAHLARLPKVATIAATGCERCGALSVAVRGPADRAP